MVAEYLYEYCQKKGKQQRILIAFGLLGMVGKPEPFARSQGLGIADITHIVSVDVDLFLKYRDPDNAGNHKYKDTLEQKVLNECFFMCHGGLVGISG
jgi:hypothetical protein